MGAPTPEWAVWVRIAVRSLGSLICRMGMAAVAHRVVMRIQWKSHAPAFLARPGPPQPQARAVGTGCPLRPQAGPLCSGHFLSRAEPAVWPVRRRSVISPVTPADCQLRVTRRTRPSLQSRVYESMSPGACGLLESGLEWGSLSLSLSLPPSFLMLMWKQPRRSHPWLEVSPGGRGRVRIRTWV